MPINRKIPSGIASDYKLWQKFFNLAQKCVVYWPIDASTYTVVGYCDSVSAANAVALANKSGQRYPRVAINWWHSTITQYSIKPISHPDARVALPSWIDADPAY